ncbi:MAG TPA: endonuclease domain-containing protein [Ramlibacter sp.]|uniref:endonuclease domain-containing protein n=1 Tax=Ramlibacter sp. TaxID=1917967 RepID=UPI002ED0D144
MKTEAPESSSSLSRLRERAGVRARALRKTQTDAENILWYHLRDRRFLDLKFRRQRPVGKYIADFACVEIGLVIELDGGQHVEQLAYDQQRAQDMQALGFQTLRFWDHEVLKETDAVMEKIRQVAEALALTPALSRKREREQDRREISK